MRSKEKQIELLENLIAMAKSRGKEGESEWLEFKTNISESHASITYERVGCYLSGLSNSACLKYQDHGYLVLGVQDGIWEVVGTNLVMPEAKINNQNYELWLRKNLDPMLNFEIEEFDYAPGVHIVIFEIPATRSVPVEFKNEAYVRIGSNLTKLKDFPDFLRQIFNSGIDWTAQVVEDATIEDLDRDAIAEARKQYKELHKDKEEECDGWDDVTFLNKAKLTINGKVTNAALILVGKSESEHFLSPHVCQIRWVQKDGGDENLNHEIMGIPMVLAVSKLAGLIFNMRYEYTIEGSMFPDTMKMYDVFTLREPICNCIAHQDYMKNARIEVIEYVREKLIFRNHGQFIPSSVEDVVISDSPESHYRNPFLCEAMKNIHMIETEGGGIRKLFIQQKKRFFPMPDYDLTDEKVRVEIGAKVMDEEFARILVNNPMLKLSDIMLLDKVQKGLKLTTEQVAYLRKQNFVEGRKNSLYLSAKVVAPTKHVGLKTDYIRNKSFDDEYFRNLIVEYIKKFGKAKRGEIDQLLLDKLSDVLTYDQKIRKIGKLLTSLRERNEIEIGEKRAWILKK